MRARLLVISFLLLLAISSASALQQLVSLQGKVDYNGVLVRSGNLTVTIHDAASGGNLVYNSTRDFDMAIVDGYFDVMLGSARNLSLENNKVYYLDLAVNSTDLDWGSDERKQFLSPVGTNFTGDTNFTFDTNTLFVDSTNNNVGIGTANPGGTMGTYSSSTKLDIVGGSTQGWLRIASGATGEDVTGVWLHPFDLTNAGWIMGTNNDGKLRLGYGSSTSEGAAVTVTKDGASGITIQTDGNVGIGTGNPATKLHVIGDLNISANATIAGGLLIGASDYTKTGSYLLNVSGNASINNTLFINSNGNVGIGITGPTKLLHVYDGTGIVGYGYPAIFEGAPGLGTAYVTVKASNQAYLWFNTTGYDKRSWVIGSETDGTNNTFRISTLISGFVGDRSAKLVIDGDGNVGIGTTAPDHRLTTGAQDKISFGYDAPPSASNKRRILIWEAAASAGSSCDTACGNAYCLGGYTDLQTAKQTCSDTANNRECICIGKA